MRIACAALIAASGGATAGCARSPEAPFAPRADWRWELPPHVPAPEVPEDNPMSEAVVELGRLLFFDFQLSIDGGRSCGICHEPAKGFTDGFVRAVGTFNDLHPRNTLSVANVAWRAPLTWRAPDNFSLEDQLLAPLMGTDPIIEMGMAGEEALLVERLEAFAPYPAYFAAAWPDALEPITLENTARAIAAFERSLVTVDSPYDRHLQGDAGAMSGSAIRGMDLFFSDRLRCGECHSGPFLDRPLGADGAPEDASGFYNTGLYDIDGRGSYPPEEPGLVAVTGDAADTGRFRVPSLRNAATTGPWIHDGTVASLGDMLDSYARGGRLVESGQYAGDGAQNPYKDPRIAGFDMSAQDREDLLAFLDALTDERALYDPRFADPFCRDTGDVDCLEPLEL